MSKDEQASTTAGEIIGFSKMKEQVGGPVNCSDSELCTFLAGLGEGYLPTYYSDTSQSVQSKSMSIASRSYQRGKKTVIFHGFPSLQMSRNLTGDHGAALLTWYRAGFPARTSAPPAKVPESTGSAADCGARWHELSVRYDPATSSWKTHRCLWDEDLPESSLTLPKWGSMRDGVLSERMTSALRTAGKDCGLWPTPTASEHTGPGHAAQGGMNLRTAVAMWPTPTVCGNYNRKGLSANSGDGLATSVKTWPTPLATDGSKGGPNQKGGKGDLRLASAVHQVSRNWPTPVASMSKGSSPVALTRKSGADRSGDRLDHAVMASDGGQLNPTWVEWLMGWPLGWTDLKPLATDRCRNAQRRHGGF